MSDGVVIAWMYRMTDPPVGWFTWSLANVLRYDGQGPQHVVGAKGGLISLVSGPRIAEGRNQIIDKFAIDHPDASWLLMVDSDMTFDEDFVSAMVAAADPVERPIMGALAFVAAGDNLDCGPSIFKETITGDKVFVDRVYDYPSNTLMKVGAVGAAGLLIHRNVLAAMSQPYPDGFGTLQDGTPNPYPWFAEGLTNPDGKPIGEDVAFCRRARMMGIPTHVHTGIRMGHIKMYELNEDYFRARQADAAAQAGTRAERRRAARQRAKMVA